ncbi:hypothetical protein QBC32DRAFT_384980 [Pseudoneurospora amorphoporcata]|uniref:Uncharacterized protein n=1 Tax=Pseudoneurospora amorphoporcata TaxID=241081 RepID=A0AAN6NYJ9_9PEZI|nr:hypothetical protein QBC32DRAFT_384980 [Pseudoneurospora amorphoporcata]
MNKVFAELMRRSGHKYRFHGFELCWLGGRDLMNKALRTTSETLSNIIPVKFFQNQMPKDGLENIIEEYYSAFKDPELGTMSHAQKWREYAEMHIKTMIVVIDHFLRSLLSQCCSDKEVAQQLWKNAMDDQLDDAYKCALAHAEFLVDSELLRRPYTYNHYFNENIKRPKATTAAAAQSANSNSISSSSINVKLSVPLQQSNRTHADQVKENIFDVLKSYYKIARERFVNGICQQVVSRPTGVNAKER